MVLPTNLGFVALGSFISQAWLAGLNAVPSGQLTHCRVFMLNIGVGSKQFMHFRYML